MRFYSPPLVPDSEEARDWAREELSKGVYSSAPSFWEWVQEKILGFISEIIARGSGLESAFLPLTVLAVIAGIAVLALAYRGPVRRRRARAPEPGGVWHADDARTASELRAAAQTAASAGDFARAVIEQFRAIVRTLEERELIEATQGMTALEVAREVAAHFPSSRESLEAGAEVFNESLYGRGRANEADYLDLRELESRLREPERTEVPAKR